MQLLKNIKMYLKTIQNVRHYVQLRQLAGIILIMGNTNEMFSPFAPTHISWYQILHSFIDSVL